jgi:tetratricopeptide (TPR) repeat protein
MNRDGASYRGSGASRGAEASQTALAASKNALEEYPYGSDQFSRLVAESYKEGGAGDPRGFYLWMDSAYARSRCRYPGKEAMGLEDALTSAKGDLDRLGNRGEKARAEIKLSEWVHRLVKTVIPRFSLDRGFEFCNVPRYGERQCFLQSVLIAGLLQRAGMDAGIAMVYRNTRGEETNNGHAVALLKLPTGEDIIVDASDKEPFARQTGLFVRSPDYIYLDPLYEKGTAKIGSYKTASRKEEIDPDRVRPLDLSFIRSQFWYYRGERARGGVLSSARSKKGLETSVANLLTSVRLCPENPLAVYILGRAYLAQGNRRRAQEQFEQAYDLYSRYGWVPAGLREQLGLLRRRARAQGMGSALGAGVTWAGPHLTLGITHDL